MKILIVDDNKQNLALLEAILKSEGHEAVKASNGAEAFSMLVRGKFDMIISDIMMPVMDGFKLRMKCQSDETLNSIPFIFTTSSYTEAKDEEFGMNLGAEAFIVWPLDPGELLKMINDIFKGKRASMGVELAKQDIGFLETYSERLAKRLEYKIHELEDEVSLRKKTEEDLKEKIRAMEILNNSTLNREERIMELKEEVKKLKLELGRK